jgi:hypothetical protein
MMDFYSKELNRFYKLPMLLGSEILDLARQDLKVDDPIVFDTVKRIYLKISAAASKSNAVKKKQDIEAAVLRVLDLMGVDSQKDIFALLLSKAARLPQETQKKLQQELKCLEKAEREEEN